MQIGRKIYWVMVEKLEKDKVKKKIDENMDLGDYDLAAKLPLNQLWIDLGEIKKGHKYIFSARFNRNPMRKRIRFIINSIICWEK